MRDPSQSVSTNKMRNRDKFYDDVGEEIVKKKSLMNNINQRKRGRSTGRRQLLNHFSTVETNFTFSEGKERKVYTVYRMTCLSLFTTREDYSSQIR